MGSKGKGSNGDDDDLGGNSDSNEERGEVKMVQGDDNKRSGDSEEEDYGYSYIVNDTDEDASDNSDSQADLADNLLGPEDGEGEVNETNLLGFADF